MTDAQREQITAKLAQYIGIGAYRMENDIFTSLCQDHGYAIANAIRTDARSRVARPSNAAQRTRFGEVV